MDKSLRIGPLAVIVLTLLAGSAPLLGQTWPSRFDNHSYNISAGGFGGYTSTSAPTATIPFSVTQAGDTSTGSMRMRYPDALPEGIFRMVGSRLYFVLSSPITVGFHLEFDYVAASVNPPITVPTYLNLEISSGAAEENPPCKITNERRDVMSGTTTHFVKDFECTFSKLDGTFGNPAVPGNVPTISNLIDFTTFPREGFGGFLGSVFTNFRTYSPLDLTVSRIEIVQVTQDVENSIRLVADKSTVARVFVGLGSESAAIQPPTVTGILHGRNAAGAALPGSPREAAPIRAPNRPDRNQINHSLVFRLPPEWTAAGTITLRAEVNPDGSVAETDRTNNSREQSALFLPRNEFRVRWIPICVLDDTHCPPSSAVFDEARKMRRMFPVSDERLSYTFLDVPKWIWKLPLATKEDRNHFIALLRVRYEMLSDASIDQLFAWLPQDAPTGRVAGSSDPLWDSAERTGRVAWGKAGLDSRGDRPGDGFSANILAHEIGHNLGLRHTNTADCNDCRDADTDWPDPTSGTVHEFGFDTGRMWVIPSSWFDIMTYRHRPGYIAWISPFHYNKLFDGHFRPEGAASPQSTTDTSYAIVSGSARHDGTLGRLDPLVIVNSSIAPTAPAAGNHCIRFSGPSGVLSDFCFNLSFHAHPGDEELEEEYFALRIPLPAGANRVALRRGESELAGRSASANAPTVAITSPAGGETWEGRRTIIWHGSDIDGDTLTYTLLYSADGGTKWLPIETNTTATEFAFDTAEISAGNQVRFRVLASDGFRTAEGTVGPLTVVAAPVIGVQPKADFGSVKLGEFGETTLLVTNRGEKALTVRAIANSLGDFAVRENFPIVVAPKGIREITVRFTPAAEGVRASTLSFDSDDPARPVVAARVFGAGLPDPQIALTPASLDFGSVAVGASRDMTVRVRNTGRGTLTLLALGSSSSQFVLQQTTPSVAIAEGGEVSLALSFRPAAAGSQAATLSITSTAGATPVASTSLSGTGTGTGTSCQQALSPASFSLSAEGGSRSASVNAPAGCSWTAAARSEWVTIGATASGTGNGTVSFSIGPNSGLPRSAALSIGTATAVVFQSGGADFTVIPAVASTPGALGSYFKTGVQLHNPTNAPISGELAYHAAGVSGAADDPRFPYELEPGQTVAFADLLPTFQYSGLGSVDLLPGTGTAPVATIRIFNDAGEAGTTGMTEELMRPGEALEQGKRGVLIAPPEPARARFNIGVRTLAFGATIRFTVRDAGGAVRTTGAKFYPPSFFAQETAETFLGIALLANDTVTFEVDAGSAIVYGATTDNTTQDPSLQFARALSSRTDPRRTIAAVAAAPGVLDSLFRTTLQLHNPTASPISGRLVFHPAGFSGTDADPSVTYSLAAGAATSYSDVLAAFGRTGLGSLDVVAASGSVPLAIARVFNDGGARGTTGFSVDAVRPEDALQSGETGVLIAPADPAATRFNVGIRTFDAGASLSVTIRNRDGQTIRTFTKVYAPNYFEQQAGSVFLGTAPGPSESVAITVTAGSAIVYGAATDNKTQDPAIQIARARP